MSTATRFTRHIRPVVGDYRPPASRSNPKERSDRARVAELNLRNVIESGFTPKIALVAPERGTVLDYTGDGELADITFAWMDDPDRAIEDQQLISRFAGECGIWLEIESDDYQPDPVDDEFARLGSCRLTHGKVIKVHAAHWLDPVVPQLEDMIGATVELFGAEGLRPFIEPAEPVMIKSVLSADVMDELIEFHKAATVDWDPDEDRGWPEFAELPPSEPWTNLVPAMYYAELLGNHFDLPVHRVNVFVLRYPPGAGQCWHVDNTPRAPESLHRTVSYSIHLSQRGTDYEGAELETKYGTFAEAGKGDLVGFTAKTPHRVTELTRGERYALICFAVHD